MLFVTDHIAYLSGFSNSFSNSSLILTAAKLFHQEIRERTKHKASTSMARADVLHVSSFEMFTFCDVLHEIRQKTQANSRECAVRTGNHL